MQRYISAASTRIIKYPEVVAHRGAIGKFALAIQLILLNSFTMEAKNCSAEGKKVFSRCRLLMEHDFHITSTIQISRQTCKFRQRRVVLQTSSKAR